MSNIKSDLAGQRQQRMAKVERLISLGINPYPSNGVRSHSNQKLVDNFEKLENEEVTVVGRIMTWRKHGELNFVDIQDDSGRIQLYIKIFELTGTDPKRSHIGPENFDLLDIGDHIQATGILTKTKTGQVSVLLKELKLLAKALRPLPNKWNTLTDKEYRYRRRYVDMTLDPAVRERFKRRAEFWQAIRDFLNDNGFYEINIPVLEHTTGGADARPFVTHYDALGEDFYLRISHELPLKRLLGAGFEKVYDLGPRFRNEGFSDEHLPEHIAMEWYWAYADYEQGMEFTEEMFKYVLKRVYGTLKFNVRGFDVDLDKKWERVDFCDIIKEKLDVDVLNDTTERLIEVLREHSGDEIDESRNRSRIVDSLWKLIRPTIAGPIFLVGVPKFLSPLAKANTENPKKTDRFHPIIAGSELANAFSELNDPQDQLERFLDQQKLREDGDDEAHMLDIDFVEMLEYGMPPACGFGLSERIFWIFEDVSAREGVPFPPMRRGFENTTLKIYDGIVDEKPHKSLIKTEREFPEDSKIVMVLSKDTEGWKLTNTIGHISAYLGSIVGGSIVSRPHFTLKGGEKIPADSQYPVISLSGSSTQIMNLYNKVKEIEDLEIILYVEDMITYNDDDELQKALETKALEELEVRGIGLLGSGKEIDKLTKKFSLWKG